VPRREEGHVRIEETVRVLVSYDDARSQSHEVLGLVRVVPNGRVAFFHVDLAQREREERHVPIGSVGQAHGDVLMGVAGERTAVIPVDGELHNLSNTTSLALIPRP
jgi:hypothetical protein